MTPNVVKTLWKERWNEGTAIPSPKLHSQRNLPPFVPELVSCIINIPDRHFSGKPFDISNLMNPTGKEFDQQTSSVLAMIQQNGNPAANGGGGSAGPPRSLLQNAWSYQYFIIFFRLR